MPNQTSKVSPSTTKYYNVFTITKNKDGTNSKFWNKIGVAFPHGNGEGFTVFLDCLPLPDSNDAQGRAKLIIVKPREEKEKEERIEEDF